jgi:hypothetical protein
MARRVSLLFLALASPVVLLSFLIPGPGAEALFAVLAMGYPVALIALAVARQGRLGPLGVPLLVLLIIFEGCVVAMLLLRGRVLDGPWFGGLPLAAAFQLYGLWLAPLLLVALIYALTFDRYELPEEELERLRALRRDAEDGEGC